jgi:hypothetical protein
MPIDVYAPIGAFPKANESALLQRLAECLLKWTDASEIPIVRNNVGAYLHLLPAPYVTAGGIASTVVRIDVKVPEVVLSTIERRRGFIADATTIAGSLCVDDHETARTWVTVSNMVEAGFGIGGQALTNAELDAL